MELRPCVQRATLCVLGFLILSCNNGNLQKNSCVSSIDSPKPERLSLAQGNDSAFLGGFINFKLEYEKKVADPQSDTGLVKVEENASCTGIFDIFEVGSKIRARVWTAQHCIKSQKSYIKEAKVTLYDPLIAGYHENILVKEEYAERTQKAMSEVKPLGAKAEGLMRSFFYETGIAWTTQDCRDETDPIYDRIVTSSTEQVMCFTFTDMDYFEIEFPEPLHSRVRELLQEELQKKKAGLAKSETALLSLSQHWSERLAKSNKMYSEVGAAQFVDYVRFGCTPASETFGIPERDVKALASYRLTMAAICPNLEKFREIGRQYLLSGGADPFVQAASKGISGPSNLFYSEIYFDEKTKYDEETNRFWTSYIPLLRRSASSLKVHSNLNFKSLEFVNFDSFPLLDVTSADANISIEWRKKGIVMSARKNDVTKQFIKGDSGTVLSLDGKFPLLVLTAVNGEETSGGATLRPLPKPMPLPSSADANKGTSAAGEKRAGGNSGRNVDSSKKQRAGSDCL